MANDAPPTAASTSFPRLLSLDAFRGLTILGMILVNNPGSWGHMYAPLKHAEWFGWTPTDLIFPFFLFIVGTSLAYSLRKYREGAAISSAVYVRIVRRTATLIALGLGMAFVGQLFDLWWKGTPLHLDTLRFPGVLQRIALVYFAASMIVLHVGVRGQAVMAAVLLLGYWGLLHWLPNPHDPKANLTPAGNVVRVVDQAIVTPPHLYTQGKSEKTDPEGLLSTLPAIVTALIGYMCGLVIQSGGATWRTVRLLLILGAVYAGIGLGWDYLFPVSKKLWTSSFVMLTGGLGMIGLAACLALFDVAGWRKLAKPFEVVGVNAIFVFVGSGLLARLLGAIPVRAESGDGATALTWIYQAALAKPIGAYVSSDPRLASLAMAIATVMFWWILLWLMARRGWSVRV